MRDQFDGSNDKVWKDSMRFSRYHLRSILGFATMFSAIGLAGCGNACVIGFSNNGNGGLIVKAGNPPPACSLSQANGTMSAVALKSPACESCTVAARVEHVFVTVRSVQLRPSASDDSSSPDWLDLAPHLANKPRQIDLMDNSMPMILVESAIVPAGSYREFRLQFFPGSPTSAEELPAENACGEARWNCIVMADGHIESLHWPGDVPELLIPFQSIEGNSLLVLPDARTDLRLRLEPHRAAYSFSTEGWKPQNVLVGQATVVRQRPLEAENLTPD
jgi:Domain of unknown function (DUF4382)